ncbi:MAG: ATP-binding cassette domain-containing protein, partial [Prochlorothrix sp.]|nr:ATP-binding cassette domain-containing protein [Prochlorothrix sp.]
MIPIFALNQVNRSFQVQSALEQISLQIWPQERVGVIGSSGAGKSTLLRLLN